LHSDVAIMKEAAFRTVEPFEKRERGAGSRIYVLQVEPIGLEHDGAIRLGIWTMGCTHTAIRMCIKLAMIVFAMSGVSLDNLLSCRVLYGQR
jgi:hypothetical protein